MKSKAHLAKADPVLEEIISLLPVPPPVSSGNVFHDLMSCIIEQQIHYRSTKKTFQKMLIKSGLTELTPDNFEDFEQSAFEGVNLSAKKYETILNILAYWDKHKIQWTSLSDEAVKAELSSIKGVGTWTIEMILLYTLHRPDIFPADDYHLKKVMIKLYPLNPKSRLKAQMLAVAERWSPWKSLAVRYLLDWKNYNHEK